MQSFPNRPLLVRGFVFLLAGLLAVSLVSDDLPQYRPRSILVYRTYPQLVKAHSRRDLLESDLFAAFLRKRASRYSWVTARLPQICGHHHVTSSGGDMGQLLLQLQRNGMGQAYYDFTVCSPPLSLSRSSFAGPSLRQLLLAKPLTRCGSVLVTLKTGATQASLQSQSITPIHSFHD